MYVQYYGTPGTSGTESRAQIGHDSQAAAAAAAASVKDSFQEDSRSSDATTMLMLLDLIWQKIKMN